MQDYLFSIFIPSWNNLEYLKLCVASIRRNSLAAHQIIVHVNEGKDGTLEWVKEQGLDYTYSARNIGVCLSMNMMRTKARHDYIYFVNDDMYMLPGWDEALANELRRLEGNQLFYLSSSVVQPHHAPDHGTGLLANYGDKTDNFREEELLRDYTSFHIADWQGGTHPPCLVSRDLWDIIGGYSIEFSPGYGSDPDFSAKLWMVGVRYFKGLGNSWAYHFESKTTASIKANRYKMQFALKWGMSNHTFRKYFTRVGQPWDERDLPAEKGQKRRLKKAWALAWTGPNMASKLLTYKNKILSHASDLLGE